MAGRFSCNSPLVIDGCGALIAFVEGPHVLTLVRQLMDHIGHGNEWVVVFPNVMLSSNRLAACCGNPICPRLCGKMIIVMAATGG